VKNLYASQRDVIDFPKLSATDLSKYHLIVIGSHDRKVPLADRFKKYVEGGGFLVTTDKSLDKIIADIFPEMIGYDKQEIKGGAFKGEFSSIEHPFVKGATKKKTFKFWVEDKSHPIKKVRPDIEEVVSSKKLEKKYGSGAVVVAFNYEAGRIIHMLPKLHPSQSNENGHYLSAYILSNILDEAVNRAIPDEIRTATKVDQMAYVKLVILKDPSQKCVFCGSTFKDYKGKVYKCGSCKTYYHEFCIQQQLGRDGLCSNCGKLMIFEKYKSKIDATAAPRYAPPPTPPPPKPDEPKEEELPPPPPE